MTSYKEQYYSLAEEEMQKLISDSKKGSQKSQEELLKVFSNFLTKYISLLYYGKFNLNDYDIRRFVSLFIKEPSARFALMKNKISSSNLKIVNETMRGIHYMTKRYGDEEDIRQIVYMTFFVVGFKADPIEYSMERLMATDRIDEFWVLGENVEGPFDKLSIQERQLLKWRYVDGKRSSQISQIVNEHPNTVREHLSKVREKVKQILLEDEFSYEELYYLLKMENK